MDREHLIDRLPEGLATALRLEDAGQEHEVIATALGIPTESVPVLLEVAHGKLTRLAAGEDATVVNEDCDNHATGAH